MNDPESQSPNGWSAEALWEIKEEFNAMCQDTFTGILLHRKFRILQVDDTLAGMFGYEPTDLIGVTVLELSAPQSREVMLKNTFLKNEKPYKIIGLERNGATFPIEILNRIVAYREHPINVMAVRAVPAHEQAEILAPLQKAGDEFEEVNLTPDTTQLRYTNERLRLELDKRTQMEAELRDRARQQAAVAELGQHALVGTDLAVLMDEAVSLVAQTLGVEYAKIQELLPDSNTLLLRAGIGWKEGRVGHVTVEANADSQAGYTLLSSGPVIVENLGEEIRFKPSSLLQTHQVVSGMSVIIDGQNRPFGILGAHTTRVRTFTEDDIHFLQAMAKVLATAIENARLHTETKQRAEQLAVLYELDRAITTSLRLTDIYHAFAHHSSRLLTYACMSIALLEDDKIRVTYAAEKEKGTAGLPVDTMLPREGSAMGWVVTEGEPLLRHHIAEDLRFVEDELLITRGIRSSMIIPLRVKGQVIGAWNIGTQTIGGYKPDDLEIAQSMADELAIAVENARLFRQARQEIAERQQAEAVLEEERILLAQHVAKRTRDLQVANEELARAARLKDEFLASMSHELRTPLTAILGMVEVLRMEAYGPLTEKQLKSMGTIEESGRHLLDLINDILDLSKIEANKLELEISPVSVEKVCQSTLQFIKQTALKKEIEVSLDLDQTVSVLLVDERRLKQILVNLLSNAVKFTPEGGKVGLNVTSDTAQQLVHFTVWDTGIGIDKADMERLFEPFIQLDSKLARQYSGTGLGLALVDRMTRIHGGKVSVESKVGQGSRFTVSFPWSRPEKKIEGDSDLSDVAGPLTEQPLLTHETRSGLILLAEDENTTATIMADYLRLNGYQVTTVQNGIEALIQASDERPDVILMDMQMPEMDGLEATRRLRADAKLASIPVIALTALAMRGDRERCLAAGVNDYLSKPVDLQQLVAAIETQRKAKLRQKVGEHEQ